MQNKGLENNSNVVTICPHGHAHMRIGNTTLHMELDELTELIKSSLDAIEKHQLRSSNELRIFQSSVTH